MRDKTTEHILETLDIARNTLVQWCKAGCPHTKGKGRGAGNLFDEAEVAAWMRANNKTGEMGRPVGPMSDELAKAKLRKLNADADIFEMNRDQRKGLLVEKAEAERANVTKFTVIRNKFVSMASSIAPTLTGLEAAEIQGVLEERIREILTELSRQ